MIGFPKTQAEFKKGWLTFPSKKEVPNLFETQSQLYLKQLDFFSKKKESWRHFPFQKMMRQNFVFEAVKLPLAKKSLSPVNPSSLVISVQNGEPFPSFSKEKDILLCPWRDFYSSQTKLESSVRGKIHSTLKKQRNPFCHLSNAFYPHGWILIIRKNLKQPLEIHYTQNSLKNSQALNLRNFIFLENNAQAQIVELFYSRPDKKPLFLNMQTDSYIGDKAQLEHIRTDQMGEQDMLINQLFAHLSPGAKACFFSLSLNASISRWLSAVDQAEKSSSEVNGLSLLEGSQYADHNVTATLQGEKGKSRQIYKSFLLDSARQIFQSSVSIQKKAQQSDTEQLSQNFLFGHRAMAVAFPELDISADNVQARHGATVSPSTESQELAFYLQSRGIDPFKAFNLILSSLMKETFSGLQTQNQKTIQELIQKKISSIKNPIKEWL